LEEALDLSSERILNGLNDESPKHEYIFEDGMEIKISDKRKHG